MSTQEDVRRIALSLPCVEETIGHFSFSVLYKGKSKGFIWVWMERAQPKKARIANPEVLAASVGSLSAKEVLLNSDPEKYFTEPHYNGFPAILVRLAAVDEDELQDIIVEAWRCKAPVQFAPQVDWDRLRISEYPAQ